MSINHESMVGHHEHFLDEAWKEESELVKKIVAEIATENGLQNFYESIKDREKMTPDGGETLEIVCMDGRLNESGKFGSVFVRDGGQGILRKQESLDEIADGYVQAALKLGVNLIRLTSHSDCGAWGLSGKSQSEGEKYYNDLQIVIARKIAEAELPIEVILEHIPDNKHDNEGRRLTSPHPERAAYYASVPSFNPQMAKGLPKGFVISREYFAPGYAMDNAAIAIKIAFDRQHGLGQRFNPEQPFLLVAVADTSEKLTEDKKELERAKTEGIEKYLLADKSVEEQSNLRPLLEKSILVTGFLVK